MLRQRRMEKGLSQQALAEKLYVDRSSVASWETGRRVPDATLIARISEQLGVNVADLLLANEKSVFPPQVVMLDDEKIILSGSMPILEKALPDATIMGFTRPTELLQFARNNPIFLAFLDIEMGQHSGLDVCKSLLKLNPRTNVVFLTAYMEYSFDAWETGACGFLLKPLTEEAVRKQLSLLRYPQLSISFEKVETI